MNSDERLNAWLDKPWQQRDRGDKVLFAGAMTATALFLLALLILAIFDVGWLVEIALAVYTIPFEWNFGSVLMLMVLAVLFTAAFRLIDSEIQFRANVRTLGATYQLMSQTHDGPLNPVPNGFWVDPETDQVVDLYGDEDAIARLLREHDDTTPGIGREHDESDSNW